MSDDLCQCPTCGRMHRNFGFGQPKGYVGIPAAGSAAWDNKVREIEALKHDIERLTETNGQLLAQVERLESELDTANANHRAMAKQLADSGRLVERLKTPSDEALLAAGKLYGGQVDRETGLSARREAWNKIFAAILSPSPSTPSDGCSSPDRRERRKTVIVTSTDGTST